MREQYAVSNITLLKEQPVLQKEHLELKFIPIHFGTRRIRSNKKENFSATLAAKLLVLLSLNVCRSTIRA
jgi:hypothetical protein